MTVKRRVGRMLNADLLNYCREEWISGKMHTGLPLNIPQKYVGPPKGTWSSSTKDRISNITHEIVQWTRVFLPRRNECPYFAHPTTMPSDWSWGTSYALSFERLERMRLGCNRKWETDDFAITIFLECIFQACVGQMIIVHDDPESEKKNALKQKYTEFLGLPLDILYWNPLTFAIAHRVHGQQMKTGWLSNPKSLTDRQDKHNNILIETRTSNFLKMNFPESVYPDLEALMLEIQMPLSFVNETLTPSFASTSQNRTPRREKLIILHLRESQYRSAT
jgi:hypothetical protein